MDDKIKSHLFVPNLQKMKKEIKRLSELLDDYNKLLLGSRQIGYSNKNNVNA